MNHKIIRSITGLFLITLLTKFVGYIEKIVLAYYWGTGEETDVYQAIFILITAVFLITRELVEPGCMNMFVRLRREDEKRVWSYFNFIFRGVFLFSLLIVLWGMFFPEQVVSTFTPGFTNAKRQMAIDFVQVSFLGLAFYCVSSVTHIALNSVKKFVFPAIGDLALKLSILCSLIVLHAKFGIISLAYGIVLGCFLRLLVHLLSLGKYLNFSRLNMGQGYFQSLGKYFLPLLIGIIFSQCVTLLNNFWLSGMGKGEIAAIGYATKLVDFPVVIVSYTLGVVIFPFFTQMLVSGHRDNAKNLLGVVNMFLLSLFVPLTAAFLIYGQEVIEFIFKRGSFDTHSVMQTYQPLVIFAFAIVPMAVETVLVIYFFSTGNVVTPVIIGIACSLFSILITYLAIDRLGYLAVPTGFVISRYLKVLIMSTALLRSGSFHIPVTVVGKLFAGCLLFVAILLSIKQMELHLMFDGHVMLLPAMMIIAFAIYCLFLYAMKVHIYFRDTYKQLGLKYT